MTMSVFDDALRGFEAIGLMSAQRKAKQRAAAEIEVYPSCCEEDGRADRLLQRVFCRSLMGQAGYSV